MAICGENRFLLSGRRALPLQHEAPGLTPDVPRDDFALRHQHEPDRPWRITQGFEVALALGRYSFGFHSCQTLPTSPGPGLSTGSPGIQPAGVASAPPLARTS